MADSSYSASKEAKLVLYTDVDMFLEFLALDVLFKASKLCVSVRICFPGKGSRLALGPAQMGLWSIRDMIVEDRSDQVLPKGYQHAYMHTCVLNRLCYRYRSSA